MCFFLSLFSYCLVPPALEERERERIVFISVSQSKKPREKKSSKKRVVRDFFSFFFNFNFRFRFFLKKTPSHLISRCSPVASSTIDALSAPSSTCESR